MSESKSTARVVSALLCDDVRQEIGGKYSLMGVFTNFNVSNYQQPVRPFHIHLVLALKQKGRHVAKFEIRSFEGDFTTAMQVAIQIAPTQMDASGEHTVNLDAGVNALRFPREGRYFVDIKLGDEPITQIPFQVKTMTPPTAQ